MFRAAVSLQLLLFEVGLRVAVLDRCSLEDGLAGGRQAAGACRDVLGVACCSRSAAHHRPVQRAEACGLPALCWERDASPSPSPSFSVFREQLYGLSPCQSRGKRVTSAAPDLAQLLCARIFAFCSSFCAIRADLALSPLLMKNLAVWFE